MPEDSPPVAQAGRAVRGTSAKHLLVQGGTLPAVADAVLQATVMGIDLTVLLSISIGASSADLGCGNLAHRKYS